MTVAPLPVNVVVEANKVPVLLPSRISIVPIGLLVPDAAEMVPSNVTESPKLTGLMGAVRVVVVAIDALAGAKEIPL